VPTLKVREQNCGYPTENSGRPKGAPQIPPLRSPGFPVDLGGVVALHAPFPCRKAHTRPCPVQRGRKSGYAPVGMTILFGNGKYSFQHGSSSRPERSVVEGSAVRPSAFPNFPWGTLSRSLVWTSLLESSPGGSPGYVE
jgi:hypothetical protein